MFLLMYKEKVTSDLGEMFTDLKLRADNTGQEPITNGLLHWSICLRKAESFNPTIPLCNTFGL